jgi:hypothetical protein
MTHLHEEFWEIIYVRRSTHAMLKKEALERNLTMRDLADRLLRAVLEDRALLEKILRPPV